jgi:transcriptional regulator with XRE-family HTH domain
MSPTPKQIGRRLKARREAVGFSQATVARQARISREYLARLEAGQHDPTVGTVKRLAKALHVPLLRLLT